jgi:hypothetical protein
MLEVYNLANDPERIQKIQHATLHTEDYGLVPEHGLFGSPEWWTAVGNGTIPTIHIEGIISRIYMGSMNDWPEFELDAGDHKTTWTREGLPREAYAAGRKASLDYVVQKFKKAVTHLGAESKVVLRIAIDCGPTGMSLSRKQELYLDIMEKLLPWVRNVQTHSGWQRFKRGSLYLEAELVHNLPRRLLTAEFTEQDVHWLNSQGRMYVLRGRADKNEFYEAVVADIAELFKLVPENLRTQLIWKGPESAGHQIENQLHAG